MIALKNIIKYPLKIWEILIITYIIGILNIYIIHTYGFEGIYPIVEIIENKKIENILNINENNLFYLLFINILFLIIFNTSILNTTNIYGIKTMELIYLISFGLLGLNIIILTNDLILLFIAIELYSISIYLLVLLRISKNSSRLSIIYLLINSISSNIFLLGIAIIYKYTGSIFLDDIKYILYINDEYNIQIITFGILLLILSILLKLGTVPFNFWVLRLYVQLQERILLYQIIIPKLVFIYLLYKILNNIYIDPISQYNIFDFYQNYIFYFYYLLYCIAILSVIIGSIAGLFHNYFKSILTYSSILNMGFILLGLSNEILKNNNNINIGNHNWLIIGSSISFIEYLIIYTINTLSLFFCFLIINPKYYSYTNKFNIAINYPFLSLLFLFSIFSFIGIPPFAGFYAKLNIFINVIYSYNEIWTISLFFLFISTFISACFYLKFLLQFFFPINKTINKNIINTDSLLIINTPSSISYFYTFLSLFLILYPFISNYLFPFYSL